MKKLKEVLREVGFSDNLIDAINKTPDLGGQEVDVEDTCFQTFETDITSSTEINMSGDSNSYNYYGNETE
jgi:hypothetical protein